jgi:hypothetical protein
METLVKPDALERLEEITKTWRCNLQEVAEIVCRLDALQMRRAKEILRPFLRAEHVERLALYGRQRLPWHLAEPERSLPAAVARRLSESALREISNPEAPVEVYSEKGTRIKRLSDLNPVELSQVVDPERGIRGPKEQKKYYIAQLADTEVPAKRSAPVLVFDSAIPDREHGCVIIYGRDQGSDSKAERGVSVPLKTLRALLG